MNRLPRWLLSILVGLAAVLLTAIGLLTPSPLGWILIAVFVVVALGVLLTDPLYFYRRLAVSIVGSWITLNAAPQLSAYLNIKDSVVGYVDIQSVPSVVHVVVGMIVLFCLHLDYLRTSGAAATIGDFAGRLKAAPDQTAAILETLNSTQRGRVALQAVQQQSKFFAVDTSSLTKADQARVAIIQAEHKAEEFRLSERRKVVGMALVLMSLLACLLVYRPKREDRPKESPVTILFGPNELVSDNRLEIKVRYGTHQERVEVNDGKVVLSVPGYTDKVDSIESLNSLYRVEPEGPFDLVAGTPIQVRVVPVRKEPPSDTPSEGIIFDKPSEDEVVTTKPKASPSTARLWYTNATDADLKLFMLDLSVHYSGGDGWYGIPFQLTTEPQLWDQGFPEDSSGWFAFIVRDLKTGEDKYLRCELLFKSEEAMSWLGVQVESEGLIL